MKSDGLPQLKPVVRKNASKGLVSGCSCAQGQKALPPSNAMKVIAAARASVRPTCAGDQSRATSIAAAIARPA